MTVVLDRVSFDGPALVLEGDCLSARSAHRVLVVREFARDGEHHALTHAPAEQTPGYLRANLREFIERFGWEIGDHSYGQPILFEAYIAKLKVGRFVSMAGNVSFVLGNHRMDTVTTYPFSSLHHIWPIAPHNADHVTKGDITVGNDVWIGSFAFILSGITIGNGAVVAGNVVVTKDVPPYAIVAGNPARIVRYRFEPDIIERLQRLAWWDWDDRIINIMLPRMMQSDIRAFLDYCEQNPSQLVVPSGS